MHVPCWRVNIDPLAIQLIQPYQCFPCRFYTLFLFSHGNYSLLIDFAEESLELYPHDLFYSTYAAAAYYYTNRYNRLRRILPDVHPSLLRELCPEMWDNPRVAPLLELLPNENNNKNAKQ